MKHELKTWIPFFRNVVSGIKKFEIRLNDRDFKLGDELILQEYDNENYSYTGNEVTVKVIYTLNGGNFGVEKGYILMGIELNNLLPSELLKQRDEILSLLKEILKDGFNNYEQEKTAELIKKSTE